MKRNILVLSIVAIIMFVGLYAALIFLSTEDTADVEAMSVANQLFSAGHYQEAANVYEQLLDQGMVDSALFYNLGNTYLVQGDLGRAVLNYQRAAQLDPRDADIQANLALARIQAVDVYTEEAPGPLRSLAGLTGNWLTLNENSLAVLVMWFIVAFLVMVYRQLQPGKTRKVVQYGMILGMFMLLLGGVSLGARLYIDQTQPGGVIVADTVTLNSAPGEEFATDYSLFSGMEVRMLETQGEWVRLMGPNEGLDGWIPLGAVESIGRGGDGVGPSTN